MAKRNISITYLRALAAASIFVCHILFISGCFKTSMWFNTGVPLFLIISGFLMSQKRICLNVSGIITFYKSRIKKVYLPYVVYILAISIVLFLVRKPPPPIGLVMYLMGCSALSENSILGLGHLWFMTVLLICYLQTPLLYYIRQKHSSREGGGDRQVLFITNNTVFSFLFNG